MHVVHAGHLLLLQQAAGKVCVAQLCVERAAWWAEQRCERSTLRLQQGEGVWGAGQPSMRQDYGQQDGQKQRKLRHADPC